MKCIALATRFGHQTITWYIPNSHTPTTFFARRAIKNFEEELKTQINELCDTLQYSESIKFKENTYFIHIQKLNEDCCAVICDEELSFPQMQYLSLYLLSNKISLSTIASNLEYYTQDFKTQAIQADLAAVLDIMKQNIDKTLTRDSKIDDLAEHAIKLEAQAIQFKRTVDEKTSSCWPSTCTIL